MNCNEVTGQLPLMLYGEMSFDEEESLQLHLEACSACQRELDSIKILHENIDTAEAVPDTELLANCRRDLRVAMGSSRRPLGFDDRLAGPNARIRGTGAVRAAFGIGVLTADR